MAATSDAPQQYKQPSRKGKKAWRKNVNISEVQEGLANVREDEIQGYLFSTPDDGRVTNIESHFNQWSNFREAFSRFIYARYYGL